MQSSPKTKCVLTRHKGKEIAKPVTPQSESISDEDSDPEQARRDKDMQKNLALLAKYFKKLYKRLPTYNFELLQTLGTRCCWGRETVGLSVVQQNGLRCLTARDMDTMPGEIAGSQSGFIDYAHGMKSLIYEQELEAHYSSWHKDSGVSPAGIKGLLDNAFGSVVNQKHDELAKKSLLTRSQFEGQLKEKSKVISDLKSIQTIHMLALNAQVYHGRSTICNPSTSRMLISDKPRLYEIPYDTSDPANRFCPMGKRQ
ncbi:hypothetical protein Tco_1316460 [Tanacetum coccineum]